VRSYGSQERFDVEWIFAVLSFSFFLFQESFPMPNPNAKSNSVAAIPESRASAPATVLSPEQLAFAELLGSLLAKRWRARHSPAHSEVPSPTAVDE
jgi:hypothetical protein